MQCQEKIGLASSTAKPAVVKICNRQIIGRPETHLIKATASLIKPSDHTIQPPIGNQRELFATADKGGRAMRLFRQFVVENHKPAERVWLAMNFNQWSSVLLTNFQIHLYGNNREIVAVTQNTAIRCLKAYGLDLKLTFYPQCQHKVRKLDAIVWCIGRQIRAQLVVLGKKDSQRKGQGRGAGGFEEWEKIWPCRR